MPTLVRSEVRLSWAVVTRYPAAPPPSLSLCGCDRAVCALGQPAGREPALRGTSAGNLSPAAAPVRPAPPAKPGVARPPALLVLPATTRLTQQPVNRATKLVSRPPQQRKQRAGWKPDFQRKFPKTTFTRAEAGSPGRLAAPVRVPGQGPAGLASEQEGPAGPGEKYRSAALPRVRQAGKVARQAAG